MYLGIEKYNTLNNAYVSSEAFKKWIVFIHQHWIKSKISQSEYWLFYFDIIQLCLEHIQILCFLWDVINQWNEKNFPWEIPFNRLE